MEGSFDAFPPVLLISQTLLPFLPEGGQSKHQGSSIPMDFVIAVLGGQTSGLGHSTQCVWSHGPWHNDGSLTGVNTGATDRGEGPASFPTLGLPAWSFI